MSLSSDEIREAGPLLLATGTAGLAWRRLRSLAPTGWPPVANALRDAYRSQVLLDAVHGHQLGEVTRVLEAAGVPFLLGKGWAASRLYPEPGLRAYGDLDLYVAAPAHAAALALLRAPNVPLVPVDLHRGFSDLDDLSESSLFERSRRVSLAAGLVPVFGPEDHLRLLCLHGLRHGLSRPVWLCDVSIALESRGVDFDWDRLLGGDRGRARAVACALGLAQRLLGVQLEGTPVAGVRLPRWLVGAVLDQWGSGSGWREPMGAVLRRSRGVLRELGRRWPNPLEATMGLRAPLDDLPRLPFQLVFAAVRAVRFARAGSAALWRAGRAPALF